MQSPGKVLRKCHPDHRHLWVLLVVQGCSNPSGYEAGSACNASTLTWFSLLYVGVGFLADGLMTGDWLGGIIWEGCFGPGGVPPEAIAGDGMVALETGTDGCMGPDLLVESGCGMDLDEG